MSGGKHTSGPWRAVMYVPAPAGEGATWPADDGTGLHVGQSATDHSPRLAVRSPAGMRDNLMGCADGGYVAEVIIWRGGGEVALEEAKANARLLAAAPDLLACLEQMVERHEALGRPDDGWDGIYIDEAKAAIAKAKGEQP